MIKINGKVYTGNSISINNNRIVIDGHDLTPDTKEINISIDGDIEKIKVDLCNKILIKGNCGSLQAKNGDIEVGGDVTGSINSMNGDIDCGDVGGSIQAMNGDVKNCKR